MVKSVIGAVLGAVGMYLLDPRLGRGRRIRIKDQAGAALRRGIQGAKGRADYARGKAEGLRRAGAPDSPPDNDQTLVAKVESEALSRWTHPKGRINVNAVGGVVELRGTCDGEEEIAAVEADVRKVTGVVDVRNYLHVPGTPAPNTQAR